MSSASQVLEAEASSLKLAWQELRSKVPRDHILIEEQVLDDGSTKTVQEEATSLEEALKKARTKVPANAAMEDESILRQPLQETLEVVAFDEREARQKANVSYPRQVQSVSIKDAVRTGFLGIGRRPGTFVISIIQNAEVAITYRRPASVRATAATAAMVPTMKARFWKGGGPIRRESLYKEQESALLGLSSFAATGDATAAAEIRSIIDRAGQVLLDVGEFSSYHGYQRQQVAAQILGLVGGTKSIDALEDALRLQDRHAGCSQYSNRTSTKPLVEGTIREAIKRLQTPVAPT